MMSFSKKEPGNVNPKYIERHEWRMSNVDKIHSIQEAYPYQFFVSPVFKLHHLKWFLKFHPNGKGEKQNKGHVDFDIFMEGLTPNLSEVSAKFRISLNEENACDEPRIFSTPRICYGELFVPLVTTKQLKNLARIKIVVEIELIRVLDINGNVTVDSECQHSLHLYPQLSQIKESAVSITSGADKKNDGLTFSDKLEITDSISKMAEMERKLTALSERVRALELFIKCGKSDQDNNNEFVADEMRKMSKKNKLNSWLVDKVKLAEYYHLFVEHGYNTLEAVSFGITDEILLSMGIELVGHRELIMFRVMQLKARPQPANQLQCNEEEGFAAYTHQ